MNGHVFPVDVTDAEREFGFVVEAVPLTGKLVVANLGFGAHGL